MDDQRKPYRYSLKRLYEWFSQLDGKVDEVQEQMGDIPPHSHKMSDVRGLADAIKGEQDFHVSVDWDDVDKKPEELISAATLARISHLEEAKRDAGEGIPFSDLVDTPDIYPPEQHGHKIADVEGLENALERKREVTDFQTLEETTGAMEALRGKANAEHSHDMDDVAGLEAALASKQDAGSSTSMENVAGLQAALAGKAASKHGHAIADVTGLQTALDGKAAAKHGHAIEDVTGLQTALDGKAVSKHSHAIADTNGLQAALDAKANSKHGHTIAEVEGLRAALDTAIVNVQVSGTTLTFIRANGQTAQAVKVGGLLGL